MNEFDTPNSTEYTYGKRAEGRLKLLRVLTVLGYVIFLSLFFLFCYLTRIIPLFAIAPLVLWILVFFTWRYVSYDCYFEFTSGELTLGRSRRTRAGMKRTAVVRIRVKDARIYSVAPGDPVIGKISHGYDLSSSHSSPAMTAIEFSFNGRDTVALFDRTDKLASLLRHYSDSVNISRIQA